MKYCKFLFLLILFAPQILRAQFLFQDTTNSTGIFAHSSNIDGIGPGVVVFDLDGDGWDDLFLPGGQDSNKLFLNMHNGTFRDITPKNITVDSTSPEGAWRIYPRGGIAFDYDNDGLTDLYLTCEKRDILWHNNGDGTFTDVTRYPALLNFPLEQNESMGATFGDFNGDGWNDFYVARWVAGSSPNYFYVNNHDGSFSDRAKELGVDHNTAGTIVALFFDYDRDGDLDLLLGNDSTGPNRVFKNMLMETGVATFVDVTDTIGFAQQLFGMSIVPNDFNRDGNFDFYETSIGNDLELQNNSNKFQINQSIKTSAYGGSAVLSDFDNDGWEDAFVAHGIPGAFSKNTNDSSIFYHNDKSVFKDVTNSSGALIVRGTGAASLDFTHDGKIDICIGTFTRDPSTTVTSDFRLLQNITPNSGHWLEMRFTARRTAKEAIGTIVDVWAGGVIHSRQVSTGGGFASQNSLMQHVGLGAFLKADSIIIYWPADKNRHREIDRYYNVKADTILHIIEGPTGAVAIINEKELKIFPTPATDVLNLQNLPDGKNHIEIFNMLGERQIDEAAFGGSTSIKIYKLNPGCYILRITNENQILQKWFIKD